MLLSDQVGSEADKHNNKDLPRRVHRAPHASRGRLTARRH